MSGLPPYAQSSHNERQMEYAKKPHLKVRANSNLLGKDLNQDWGQPADAATPPETMR